MALRPLLPAILLSLVVSIVIGVLAVGRNDGLTLALAAVLFALQMLFAMVRTNAPYWRSDVVPSVDTLAECMRRNAVLGGLVYAWGAAAMLTIYSLPGITWQHWWQYGAAMALVSAGILIYAGLLASGRGSYGSARALRILMVLTIVQGLAVVTVLVYLIWSSKLFTTRGDWAANYIFTAGSATLALLSLISIMTYLKIIGGDGESQA